MNGYWDSFDCQIQCEEVYWQDSCIMIDGDDEVSDEELMALIESMPE